MMVLLFQHFVMNAFLMDLINDLDCHVTNMDIHDRNHLHVMQPNLDYIHRNYENVLHLVVLLLYRQQFQYNQHYYQHHHRYYQYIHHFDRNNNHVYVILMNQYHVVLPIRAYPAMESPMLFD